MICSWNWYHRTNAVLYRYQSIERSTSSICTFRKTNILNANIFSCSNQRGNSRIVPLPPPSRNLRSNSYSYFSRSSSFSQNFSSSCPPSPISESSSNRVYSRTSLHDCELREFHVVCFHFIVFLAFRGRLCLSVIFLTMILWCCYSEVPRLFLEQTRSCTWMWTSGKLKRSVKSWKIISC